MGNIIAKIIAFCSGGSIQKVIKCLPEIVVNVETAMEDGVITPAERKGLAVATVDIVAKNFDVKLNSLTKWMISIMIDNIAKALPSKDIAVPEIVLKIVKEWSK